MNRKSIATLVMKIMLFVPFSVNVFAETSYTDVNSNFEGVGNTTGYVQAANSGKIAAKDLKVTAFDTNSAAFDNVITKKYGDVKLHIFQSENISSLIIENKKLTIIDYPGDSAEQAVKFKEYVESLHKPVDRIIISHTHNPHWLGVDKVFPGIPLYSVDADQIHAKAEGKSLPVTKLEDNGKLTIDGVKYEFKTNREINAWEIRLPDQKAAFIEHIGYVQQHILNARIDVRLALLQELDRDNYTWFMPGHGLPMKAPEFVNQVTAYYTDILDAPTRYASAAEAKNAIMKNYPDYTGEAALENYFKTQYK